MTVLVVMGVSGCGKSTVAGLLSERLGWPFMEGDSLHPEANVAKMAAGQPLSDTDRWPWLDRIADWVEQRLVAGEDGIITCSALKRSYRDVIARGRTGVTNEVVFVHLVGQRRTLGERMRARTGHFMPASMLDSQLETLEPLEEDEEGVEVAIELTPQEIVDQVVTELGLGG